MATYIGTSGNDKITGSKLDDSIEGLGGNDIINASDGNDVVYGGTGNDRLSGGAGNDHIYGDDGDDFIYGNDGNDYLSGGKGDNYIFGGAGNDILKSGPGLVEFNTRWLSGDLGNDTIYGSSADDQLVGGSGKDILIGGGGFDIFLYSNVNESSQLAGSMDIIKDLKWDDYIDLSSIDANPFLPGNNQFTLISGESEFFAVGQLKFNADDHILYGNTDKNFATAELAIKLVSPFPSAGLPFLSEHEERQQLLRLSK